MLEDREIVNIVSNELNQSAGGDENDLIEANRQAALASYLGQPDGRETKGRSSVVSTDVADAIEWIMPEIVKAFTENNEIVTFDPVCEGDEDFAELQSKYVYDILMKDNEGFLVIHQFIKDALMQKNGFIKVFYEKSSEKSSEHYTGLNEQEYMAVASDASVEITEMTVTEDQGIPFFDIKVERERDTSKVNVVPIPPEEFRVNRQHNSVCLKEARFTSHVVEKTVSQLVEEGYDKDVIDTLPSLSTIYDDSDYRFNYQSEVTDAEFGLDPSQKKIEVSESYMDLDINEDGVSEYVKVVIAGGETGGVLLEWEEIDENPFISATAIIMSHKLYGLSIYDRLKQIQEQKTALWRNIFDNLYLQNNGRTIVVENQVNIDDLLVSRPGGVVRAKRLDAVAPLQTPQLSADAYKMMDYLDVVRAGRSGVSPDGPVNENSIGDRVGSDGIERMLSKKEELVGLMVRVFAETGIKPLCLKIHSQVIKHQDVVKDYKFRGKWTKINPSEWFSRNRTTIRVGTGTGNKKEQAAALTNLIMIQEKILANPAQSLILEEQVYNAVDDFAKLSGMPGAARYLLDPKTPEGVQNKQKVEQNKKQQQQQEIQEKQALAQAQTKIAEAEMQKAKTASENVQLKAQIDTVKNQLDNQQQMSDAEVQHLKQQLEEAKALIAAEGKQAEIDFRYYDANKRYEIEEERLQIQRMQANNQNKEKSDG